MEADDFSGNIDCNRLTFSSSISDKEIIKDNKPWKIIVADDEEEVHKITRLALEDYNFQGRGLEFFSTYSARETKNVILKNPDVAIILLDVVMETDDAGLQLIRYIRDELKNNLVQIILRTGQPGQAPEQDIITKYEINDYKSKVELTAQKLFTTISASLRSYSLASSLNQLNEALKSELEIRISAERALRESEEKYRMVVDNANDAIIIIQDDIIKFCNPKGIKLIGYSLYELTKMNFWEFIILEDIISQ